MKDKIWLPIFILKLLFLNVNLVLKGIRLFKLELHKEADSSYLITPAMSTKCPKATFKEAA